nr:hypothetical protein [Tanacetum cinerariifolium]
AFQVTADVPEIYMQEFWASVNFIIHQSVSRLTQRRAFLTWKPSEKCCMLAPEYQINLLLICPLKRRFWTS